MPTFTAIALDRLLDPGSSKSMASIKNVPDSKVGRITQDTKLARGIPAPNTKLERGTSLPSFKPERSNGTSTTTDKRHGWDKPALYATPESTPLPESPSSFPPSPFIINHKRRGPSLQKSYSEDDVTAQQQVVEEEKTAGCSRSADGKVADSAKGETFTYRQIVGSAEDDHVMETVCSPGEHVNGDCVEECGSSDMSDGLDSKNGSLKSVTFTLEPDIQANNFFDPQDSMSATSNPEGESTGRAEWSLDLSTPFAEFYDAWEEISSEIGVQPPVHDIEAELREMRLSLLMEIEKRNQAEETLNNMQSQWLKIREQLVPVELKLSADVAEMEVEQSTDPAEDLSRQVYLARFVSNSIGRGIAKAEVEAKMEAQIALKNFEIARLLDRLRYYEAVNREMSQRNQEAVDSARRLRQRRRRRQRWVWGSVGAAIALGAAALAWSYLPTGRRSSSSNQTTHASED